MNLMIVWSVDFVRKTAHLMQFTGGTIQSTQLCFFHYHDVIQRRINRHRINHFASPPSVYALFVNHQSISPLGKYLPNLCTARCMAAKFSGFAEECTLLLVAQMYLPPGAWVFRTPFTYSSISSTVYQSAEHYSQYRP